jgi:FkbM family methyltransferase
MNLAIQRTLIGAYSLINRSGLLELYPFKHLFRNVYFAYKRYLEDSLATLLRASPHLCSGGLVLDVGANIGYTSILFSKYVGSADKVISFEPDRVNFKNLSEVVAGRANIFPIWAAVGDVDGEATFWTNPMHHADSRVVTASFGDKLGDDHSVYSVPIVSIDSYLASHHQGARVALIKIDVQGYEEKVLNGCRKTLADNRDIAVVFEFSPEGAQDLGFDPQFPLTFFREQGFKLFAWNRSGRLRPCNTEDIRSELGDNGYCDIVASRSDLCSSVRQK